MNYREPIFRPPGEAESLIIQVAYGCPHNTCLFCPMYKGVKYQLRDFDELKKEIASAGRAYPETMRIFLADGDVMALSFERLAEILGHLKTSFPNLARVNVYANGSSITAKSADQLKALKDLKLNTLYLGLESGDEELLKLVRKGETAQGMAEAVRIAQDCGLRCSVMVLLGLGGSKMAAQHAVKTAEVLNQMQPRLLSFLRFIEVPGTNMFDGYETATEYGAVQELHDMMRGLELRRTVVRANHSSNPLPLEGRLPQDKERLLREIEAMLGSRHLDRKGPGRIPMWL